MGICDGRVVIVTGAGRGIGRAHALALGAAGARVVVNDLGVQSDGTGAVVTAGPAAEVVAEIRAAGGEAIDNTDDITDWAGSKRLVDAAIGAFGRLDAVVNNAGFTRDRMFVNASEDEWDAVLRVHLRGHFCTARHASAYWRDAKKRGEAVDARIINTTSGAGLQGSIGQAAYSAAKGGIASLTLVQAAELARYGVTANAIAPAARTRMTEAVFAATMKKPEEGAFDAMDPANISPLIVWLASSASAHVTGRVFDIAGGKIILEDGWRDGPSVDKGGRWEPAELGSAVDALLRDAAPIKKVWGS
jgi:NAD(P)-dependent dehydrogenase (short-subunit alcohol dehydrogenase family)